MILLQNLGGSMLRHQLMEGLNLNLKTALIKNSFKKYFIVIVDPKEMNDFENYLNSEQLILVEWLDERDE